MGEDKALVRVGDRTMLEHVVATIAPAVDEVVVAGRDEAPPGTTPIPDDGQSHRGPLAGILAAHRRHPDDTLVVVAVDEPWVRTETLRAMAGIAADLPVVPVEEGVRQTNCAVYPAASLHAAGEELEAGGSIQSLLDRTAFRPVVEDEWTSWGEDGRSWYSADTPAAVADGIARWGTP